jgi:hypothetical protein
VPNTRTQDRDSTAHTIGATGHVLVPGTKLRGQLGYQDVDTRADGSDWDFDGQGITAMATHPLPWDVVGVTTSQKQPSVRQRFATHQLAGDDHFHDLRRAVADLEAHHVAHALLERQLVRVAVVAVEEQALVDRLH